jgi:hypothetical protein
VFFYREKNWVIIRHQTGLYRLLCPLSYLCVILTCLTLYYVTISGQNSQDTVYEDPAGGNEKKGLPEPLWLLILEVFAAVTMLCLLTLCTVTGLRKCKGRSSGSENSVPRTRAVSWKESTVILIGQSLRSIHVTDKIEHYTVLITKSPVTAYVDDDLLANVRKISRQELSEACEDFSNIIGSSHKTVVYKGTLEDGREIAVVSLCASTHYWNNYVELSFQKEARDH